MKTNKTNNYGLSGLIAVTILLGCILSSTRVSADNDSVTDQITITVPTTCTMYSSVTTGNEHSASISPGTYSAASGSEYENGIGKTTLTSFCNDYNGFSIYAIGYTGNIEGINTLMDTSVSSGATIDTAVYASGDTTSSWSMKITKVDNPAQGDPVAYNPQNMTISTDTEGIFSSWHTVPDEYTKVAEYHASTGSSATDGGTGALGAKIETTYAAFIDQTQPADTYTGQVKYVMIHPYNETAPTIPVATTCTTPVPNLTYM